MVKGLKEQAETPLSIVITVMQRKAEYDKVVNADKRGPGVVKKSGMKFLRYAAEEGENPNGLFFSFCTSSWQRIGDMEHCWGCDKCGPTEGVFHCGKCDKCTSGAANGYEGVCMFCRGISMTRSEKIEEEKRMKQKEEQIATRKRNRSSTVGVGRSSSRPRIEAPVSNSFLAQRHK